MPVHLLPSFCIPLPPNLFMHSSHRSLGLPGLPLPSTLWASAGLLCQAFSSHSLHKIDSLQTNILTRFVKLSFSLISAINSSILRFSVLGLVIPLNRLSCFHKPTPLLSFLCQRHRLLAIYVCWGNKNRAPVFHHTFRVPPDVCAHPRQCKTVIVLRTVPRAFSRSVEITPSSSYLSNFYSTNCLRANTHKLFLFLFKTPVVLHRFRLHYCFTLSTRTFSIITQFLNDDK